MPNSAKSTYLVDQLRAASDQAATYPVQTLHTLLLDRFHRNKTHVRPHDRVGNGLSIIGIVLVRLHIRLNELRRHQTHRLPRGAEHPCPVVSASTGLNAHHARFELAKELLHLMAPQLPLERHPACLVHPVCLKHMLCYVQSYCGHLLHRSNLRPATLLPRLTRTGPYH
jgi:hypothetical protein